MALAVGGYFLFQKQSKSASVPQPVSQPPPIPVVSPAPNGTGETTNWKTYINQEFGFEFRYPDTILVKEIGKDISVRKKAEDADNSYQIFIISKTQREDLSSFKECRINTDGSINAPFPCYIQTENSSSYEYPQRIENLGNYKTMDIRTRYMGTGRSERIVKTIEGPKIEISISYGEGFDEELEKIIHQILSTFKFTQ